MKRLAVLFGLLMFFVPVRAQCVSNCVHSTACDWATAESWSNCAGGYPDTSSNTWTISAGETITLNTDGLNVGRGVINGTLTFGTNMAANTDALYGFRRLTITNGAGADAIAISPTGKLVLRGSQGIIFDNAAGVTRVAQATTGILDIQGFAHRTQIAVFESAAATEASCGTTSGYQWLITPETGFEFAKKFRRIVIESGKARARHFEIVSTDPTDMCTAAGAPWPCCTGNNLGTCTTSQSIAVCTDLLDPGSCDGVNNPPTSGSGTAWCTGLGTGISLQRLTPHTANIVYQTIGAGGNIYRHPVPMYSPLGGCSAANQDFEFCTGLGAGTTELTDATVVPAVGDLLTIIDDVQFSSTTPAHGYDLNTQNNSSSSTVTPPVIQAANFYGIGDPTHKGIFFYPLTAGLEFNDILYNNLHELVGQDAIKIRGFNNYAIRWNAIHDATYPRSMEQDAAIYVTASLSTGSGGDTNVNAGSNNVEVTDNWIYANEGDGISVQEIGYSVYASDVKVLRNLIEGGSARATIQVSSGSDCTGDGTPTTCCQSAGVPCDPAGCVAAGNPYVCCTGLHTGTRCDSDSIRTSYGVSMGPCIGCEVAYNVIHDACSQTYSGAINTRSPAAGVALGVTVAPSYPTAVSINSALDGTVVHHNWIVNSCGYGITAILGENNTGQNVVIAHNYISHTRIHGILGGKAYGNVIANTGIENVGGSIGMMNPIRAYGNFIIGADDNTDSLVANGLIVGINETSDQWTGNMNGTAVILSDNVITKPSVAHFMGLRTSGTAAFHITAAHFTCDADGETTRAACVGFVGTGGAGTTTWTGTDFAATNANGGPIARCTAGGTIVDTLSTYLINTSSITAENVTDEFNGGCTSKSGQVYGHDIFPNRTRLDYNWPVNSTYLTAGTDSSALGARAFRFNRDIMADVWGGAMSWIYPFPTNISNTSNVDTDSDGIIDLHDDCDEQADPAQMDSDDDGRGDPCDNCPRDNNPWQGDLDGDGLGDACDPDRDGDLVDDAADLCPEVSDPDQSDRDTDGLGDLCDNCPRSTNLAHTDIDHDGQDDVCDPDSDTLFIAFMDVNRIELFNQAEYDSVNIYRGDLEALRELRVYTQNPAAYPLAERRCAFTLDSATDTAVLQPGHAIFFMLSGNRSGIEGEIGYDSTGAERLNTFPCIPPIAGSNQKPRR